jgi:periplasmic protein TonB
MHSGAPTLFTTVLHAPARSAADRARLLRALPFAFAVHVLALAAALHLHATGTPSPGGRGATEALTLRLLSAPATHLRVPAPPAARARAPSRRPARLAGSRGAPQTRTAAVQPAPPAQPTEAEVSATTGSVVGAVVAGALLAEAGPRDSAHAGGSSGAGRGARPGAEPRAQSLDEYLWALARSRFQHVPYPPRAAVEGRTGMVTVRLTIGARGELLAMERVGRCPHAALCEGAEEAVRNALPFLPPPAELGRPLTFELPFRFRLY